MMGWCKRKGRIMTLLVVLYAFCTWLQAYSLDCEGFPCTAPYTQTPVGAPCGCVVPMQVKLELNVTLERLFPQVSALVGEISYGLLLLPSQVRVVGAVADGEDEGRSIVRIDLVPLGKSFDNLTAVMIIQRLSNHQVLNSNSFFSNYTLVYVHYPGLPPSTANTTIGELPAAEVWPHEQPLSVDVSQGGRKVGGGTLALILLSSAIAAAACGVLVLLFLKFNKLATTFRATGKSRSPRLDFFKAPHPSSMAACTLAARVFSICELERATDNFNMDNVVGQGGYGRVYAGILEDGVEVAVKLMIGDDQQKKEFFAELEMLSRVHHRNLVKLIGACAEENRCCVVYELIANGNVESHLHGDNKLVQPLDWNTRMKIALGAARGLAYLHEDANPRVIHRDFKASNILLDRDFTPKISDFGLAKIAPDKEDGHISTSVMGTFGYVAPEYAMTGHLLVKSDVYSFGVVLLELLSGRRPIDLSQPPGKENLVNWARPLLLKEDGLEALGDPMLEGKFAFEVFAKVAAIASMCVQPDPSHRPFMGEVVQALKVVCCASEGISSVSVSPEASGGDQSDCGGQASDSKSGPLVQTDNGSSTSAEFGFNIVCRETDELFSTRSSDSGYIHQLLFNSSGRHSISGPSSSNETAYTWSKGDNMHAAKSEHRAFWNKVKAMKPETRGSWP